MTALPERTVEASLAACAPFASWGCTCPWDDEGNPPPSCRCGERARREKAERRRAELDAAMDPALGPDRLVVAGEHEREVRADQTRRIVEWLRHNIKPAVFAASVADAIEREFGGGDEDVPQVSPMPSEPLRDEAAIEAAMRHFYEPQLDVIAGFREPCRSKYVDALRRATREGIAAYFAALDRDALSIAGRLEAMAGLLSLPHGPAVLEVVVDDLLCAASRLRALGLIPTEGGNDAV